METPESKTTYITQPGSGQLFKNKFKNSDKHPDYRGEIVTPSGEKLEVAGWIQASKSGENFIGLKISPEYKKPTATADDMLAPVSVVNSADLMNSDAPADPSKNDDDLPF